jgi:hypothetical protein
LTPLMTMALLARELLLLLSLPCFLFGNLTFSLSSILTGPREI